MKEQAVFGFDEGLKELERIFSSASDGVMLAIAGGSCSGKSFLAAALRQNLLNRGLTVSVLPLDNFFKDKDDPDIPRDSIGRKLFDVPESYRHCLFRHCAEQLSSGMDVYIPDYRKATNSILSDQGEKITHCPRRIAEGLFVIDFLRDIGGPKKTVFVDTPEETRLSRRVRRDTERFGVTEARVVEFWETRVKPNYIRYVEPQREEADIIIYGH
ncbi:MAG: hypothetical protein V1867_02840 [Candidatus Falkowbacteria bacterium]